MSNEIRRRRTDSPEIDAMIVLEQAFEGLDPDARKRVMTWAEEKFIGSVLQLRIDRDREATKEFSNASTAMSLWMEELRRVANNLNMVPIDLLNAAKFISDQADELKAKREEKAAES